MELLQRLQNSTGRGTSLISYYIPPRYPMGKVSSFLTMEIGTATNIKSRINRLSVLSALKHVMAKLKLYKSIPDTGIALFSGSYI